MRQSTHSGSRRTSSGWMAKPVVSKNYRWVSSGGSAAGSEPASRQGMMCSRMIWVVISASRPCYAVV